MFNVELQVIRSGYDRKSCWVHARPGTIPGNPPVVLVTMHKLLLAGCDVYYEINDMRSEDGGKTWSDPIAHTEALGRRTVEEGTVESICDFWPMWHEKTGVLLGTGHVVSYRDDKMPVFDTPVVASYSVYNADKRTWAPFVKLDMPEFIKSGAGSTQRVDLPNGDILLPTYRKTVGKKGNVLKDGFHEFQYTATVVKCAFDGEKLTYLEHGTELTVPTGRGFAEPSLAYAAKRYFLTLRNNDAGFVTCSEDGLHYEKPRLWTFDDGKDLGSYNTQQHWVTHGDDLYLVYTRKGANNDHIFRHRAPLFMAKIDKDRLCVIRATEQILVPERGARLGNFGVTTISENESWVVVSEWMQTNPPDPFDFRVCEKYGSDNSIFLAKIRYDT